MQIFGFAIFVLDHECSVYSNYLNFRQYLLTWVSVRATTGIYDVLIHVLPYFIVNDLNASMR